MDVSVSNYLKQIGYFGEAEVNLKSLTQIQHCHLSTIPYSNLDNFLNVKKELDTKILYDRIVDMGMGGWCHEINGLLHFLLSQIEFKVQVGAWY